MKPFPMIAVAAFALPAPAAAPKQVPMRDAATHDQIVETARDAAKHTPPPVFTPVGGTDPAVANRPKDLLSRSEILSYLGQSTLVPKRAVLHVPKDLAGRLVMQESSRFIPWRDFLLTNRAWIRTVAVTRPQAEGKEPMDEQTLKSFAKETRLVVATYQDGPISVMPPRIPQPAAAPAGTTPALNANPAAKP